MRSRRVWCREVVVLLVVVEVEVEVEVVLLGCWQRRRSVGEVGDVDVLRRVRMQGRQQRIELNGECIVRRSCISLSFFVN